MSLKSNSVRLWHLSNSHVLSPANPQYLFALTWNLLEKKRMLHEPPSICWSLCNMHLQQFSFSNSPLNHDLRLLLPVFHSPTAIWQQWLCLQHQFLPVKCFHWYPKTCLVGLSWKTPQGSVFPWAMVMDVRNTSVNLWNWQGTEENSMMRPTKTPSSLSFSGNVEIWWQLSYISEYGVFQQSDRRVMCSTQS